MGVGIVHKNSVGVGVGIVTKMTGVGIGIERCAGIGIGVGIIECGIAPGLMLGTVKTEMKIRQYGR